MTYLSKSLGSTALMFALLAVPHASVNATDNPPGTVLYTGSATVLRADVNLLRSNTRIVLADTGEIDSQGNTRDATVVDFSNPQPLQVDAKVAHAIASGSGGVSASTAAVEKLSIKVGALSITADAIESNSFAQCDQNSSTVATKGTSTIANLRINGRQIPVSTRPNQRIVIPLVGTIILNEQTHPDVNSVVVNAVRVSVPGLLGKVGTEIVISRAASGIFTCSGS
jgi:hypothetical protein